MENNKRNRTIRVTSDQKEVMIAFIKKIRNGKSASSISVNKWRELTVILNSIPGPVKEWKEWRQTWYSVKPTEKKNKTVTNTEVRKTRAQCKGIGSHITQQNCLDKDVIDKINNVQIIGDPCTSKSSVNVDIGIPSGIIQLQPIELTTNEHTQLVNDEINDHITDNTIMDSISMQPISNMNAEQIPIKDDKPSLYNLPINKIDYDHNKDIGLNAVQPSQNISNVSVEQISVKEDRFLMNDISNNEYIDLVDEHIKDLDIIEFNTMQPSQNIFYNTVEQTSVTDSGFLSNNQSVKEKMTDMENTTRSHNLIIKNYYEEKLKYLKDKIELKRRETEAKEIIAVSLKILSKTKDRTLF